MVKVQQRGLGKGLSALISENPVPAAPQAAAVEDVFPTASSPQAGQEIPIKSIRPGRYQPRTRFSDEQLRELSDSIRKNGVMQPILLRPVSGAIPYEIVAGERRWRASQLAGRETIPAVIRELTDAQALELALIENVQRADLSPLEEATGYQRLLEEFGYTQEELATTVGKSRSHIANLLRLLSLPDDIKALLEENKITMGHARALLTAENASQLARMTVEKGLSVRQVEAMARGGDGAARQQRPRGNGGALEKLKQTVEEISRRQHSGASGPKDADILALEQNLSESLGMRVSINEHGSGGDIVISYESLAQLDEILRRLGESVTI